MAFKLADGEQVRLVTVAKASATVISAGDFAGMTAGLAVDAAAATAAIAWCPKGAEDGETTCEVTVGNDFTLIGTSDANFAVTDKGLEVDLTAAQLIDLGESTTDVLKVDISNTAGTAGSTSNVKVRINKPLF
jgi:hypothetical protein